MRVLSTKLNLIDSLTDEQFYGIIIKWLKAAGPCKSAGDTFENSEDKANTHFQVDYCTVDTLSIEKDDCAYRLFRLIHVFHEQAWTTEVILKTTVEDKIVYFHIDCSRDASRFDEIPEIRSDIIRAFIKSGFIRQSSVPVTMRPLETTPEILDLVASAIREEYNCEMPLVLITTYFGTMAGEIGEETIARKLAGMAYIVKCNNEETRILQDKAKRQAPFNGAIAIYSKDGKPKQFRKSDAFHGAPLDSMVLREVQRIITAHVDAEAPTWNALHTEQVRTDAQEKSELLDVAFGENESLDEQLKKAKERIAELVRDNLQLNARLESLESALEEGGSGGVIEKSPIEEFFDGEQHDLVVTILTKALANCGTQDTRRRELLVDLLEHNRIIGNGKEMLEVVKTVFANGEGVSSRELAELKRVGFEIISENTHYKLVYKGNEKYWFTLAKTPSDSRSGKNITSDITKRISVYK